MKTHKPVLQVATLMLALSMLFFIVSCDKQEANKEAEISDPIIARFLELYEPEPLHELCLKELPEKKEEIRKLAEESLENEKKTLTNFDGGYGFTSKEELENATLAEPYQLVIPYLFEDSNPQGLIIPKCEVIYPILCEDRFCARIRAYRNEDGWEAFSFGGFGPDRILFELEKGLKNDPRPRRLLTVFGLAYDYLLLEEEGVAPEDWEIIKLGDEQTDLGIFPKKKVSNQTQTFNSIKGLVFEEVEKIKARPKGPFLED